MSYHNKHDLWESKNWSLHRAVYRWFGGNDSFTNPEDWSPNGVPQAGDTAVIPSGDASVPSGFGNGVNFLLQGGSISFDVAGTFHTGMWAGTGTVYIGSFATTVAATTTGIRLGGNLLDVAEFVGSGSSFAIDGNSKLTNGSALNVGLVGTAGLPAGEIENDGTMAVSGSSLYVGELTGNGVVRAANDSTLDVTSAGTGETIQLTSGHLYIGPGPFPFSTVLQFLAPITHFGAGSEITLENTQATSEVFSKSSPNAGELFLYDGSALVADLHISGARQVHASNIQQGSSAPSVLLTAYDTGQSIPTVTTKA